MSDQQPPFEPPEGPPPGPRPWEAGGTPTSPLGSGPQYPRQNLLPQEVKPGRNRAPIFIGIGVVLALVVAGAIAYLVLRDDGEGTRAAYCSALRELTNNGDVISAVEGADPRSVDDFKAVVDLAPNAVADDWAKIDKGIRDAQSGSPDMSQALAIFGALRVIAKDAKDNCDLDLGIPML